MRSLMTMTIFAILIIASPSFARSGLPDFTQLIEEHSPAVVKINVSADPKTNRSNRLPNQQIPEIFRHFFDMPQQQRPMQSMGSGFIVSDDGYILTNHHVVEGADSIVVRMTDRSEFQADLIGSDPRSDLALLKIDNNEICFRCFKLIFF